MKFPTHQTHQHQNNFGLRWQSAAATSFSPAMKSLESGVALRFPPQSKIVNRLAAIIFISLTTTVFFAPALRAADIPDRPEKLSFPPLKYDAPVPDQYRVQLKSGPVVYIVPDHERPLVNISVYVRTGKYLEPAGKEGLAELT